MDKYEKLYKFCERKIEKELIQVLALGLTVEEAAKRIDKSERQTYRILKAIRLRAMESGSEDHFIYDPQLEDTGFLISKTSTMYGPEGPKIQWVTANRTMEDQYKAFLEVLELHTHKLHRKYKKVKKPKATDKTHIVNYKTTDLHFGALMWREEVGHDYDLQKARDMLLSATKYLIDAAPKTSRCIISDTGDMVEADDYSNTTKRSGNVLDVDGRYPKILEVVLDTFVELVYMALEKHEHVTLIFTKGNHDDQTSHFVQTYLKGYFRNEKRVEIDATPTPRKYYLHGTTLLGYTHGHEMKPEKCGEIMAKECKKFFHITVHRYFSFGHLHKNIRGENVLCHWSVDRNMPPSNAWAHAMGYLGQLGTMSAVVYCKDHGLVDEFTFSVSRLQEPEEYEFTSMSLQGQLA